LGEADQHFLSTPVDLFDPSMGTLLGVSESVSGSLTWDPSEPGEQLFLVLAKRARAGLSLVRTVAVLINVNLSGAAGFPSSGVRGGGKKASALRNELLSNRSR
jgi:hypothetical protein